MRIIIGYDGSNCAQTAMTDLLRRGSEPLEVMRLTPCNVEVARSRG
jgi:hypothetical protein